MLQHNVSETILEEYLRLSLIALRSRHAVPRGVLERARIKVYEDALLGAMIAGLETYIHGLGSHRIVVNKKWPRNWWQAVRERWCPRWWLARWPVVYDEIHIDQRAYKAVCPHLSVPMPPPNTGDEIHLTWLSRVAKGGGEDS